MHYACRTCEHTIITSRARHLFLFCKCVSAWQLGRIVTVTFARSRFALGHGRIRQVAVRRNVAPNKQYREAKSNQPALLRSNK